MRGSGVDYDIRKYEPYGVYDKVEWEVPVGKRGDTYDRYWVRMEEMRQSARIIAQCLDQMPEGPIMADVPHVIPRQRRRSCAIWKRFTTLLSLRKGSAAQSETYCGTEAPKGELGFFIVSDGSPAHTGSRSAPRLFIHMGAFDHMARGYLISDIITIFGTYDIVMGECDR